MDPAPDLGTKGIEHCRVLTCLEDFKLGTHLLYKKNSDCQCSPQIMGDTLESQGLEPQQRK